MFHIHRYPKSSIHDFERGIEWGRWKVRCRCGKVKVKYLEFPILDLR